METILEILISWTPMIILIAVWIIFMKKMRLPQNKQMDYLEKQNELMEQFIAISERIAVSLETISESTNGKTQQ